MTYLFSPYLWLLLVGVPVLIHLINRLRHRRVKWAAMDFLLQSQKKQKNWIIFKQLLLLLLRMAAVALVVFMVAKPKIRSDWAELLGGSSVHHIVLLDDSFSMSDRRGDGTAFDRAKQSVERVARLASEQPGTQALTLLRTSGAQTPPLGPEETINAEFLTKLNAALAPLRPTESAAGPAAALTAMRELPSKASEENRIVYLVSDFRTREWDNPTDVRKLLGEVAESGAKIHLVQCVDAPQANLAIADIKPQVGTRAAGVELFIDVAVKNFGDEPATGVTIKLEEDRNPRPGLRIDEIPAGETVVRQFRVNFQAAGEHTVRATLDRGDAIDVDNSRFAVIAIPDAVEVLLVDGDPAAHDAKRLADAMAPGGTVQTGLRPRIERPQFLRRAEGLAEFPTIFLLNVGRLDATEIETLEGFVRAGGGLGIFVGEAVLGKFYSDDFYRGGAGLFPAPLLRSTDLLPNRSGNNTPDIVATPHPIFAQSLKLSPNPLNDVRIARYFAVPGDWQPDPSSTTRVIARLRNNAPLVIERTFGAGRVVAVLTKGSEYKTKDFGAWNNWPLSPSYLMTVALLQAYLETGKQWDDVRLVGQPITFPLDPQAYTRKVEFVTPSAEETGPVVVDAAGSGTQSQVTLTETERSGLYTALLKQSDGESRERNFAYNVSADEGDLHLLDGQGLAARLEGISYEFHRAEELSESPEQLAGVQLGDKLLLALIVLLVAEQFMAYSASYHPQRRAA